MATQPIRVMHFADTHFGVELYGKLDAVNGLNTRLTDFRKSLEQCIEIALERGIDLAVFAGDAYKNRDPRQTDQREFVACIRKLTDRGVPVVMIVGNHDMPNVRGRANAIEIYRILGVDNVTIISQPERVDIQTGRGKVRILGLPYLMKGLVVAREEFQGKSLDETRLLFEARYTAYINSLADSITDEPDDDSPVLFMGHFWVNGAKLSTWQQGYFSNQEPQVSLSDLKNPAFDYVALGHIHKHQDVNRGAYPPVVYSGSPDRIDFGEKDEPKGFCLVNLVRGGTTFEYVPIKTTRPLLDIEVTITGEEPTEQILAEIAKYDLQNELRNAIVKLSYKIPQHQLGLVCSKDIKEALAFAHYLVSITPRIERDSAARSRMLTESKTPREALDLYLDLRQDWASRRTKILEYAEPLFKALEEEEMVG